MIPTQQVLTKAAQLLLMKELDTKKLDGFKQAAEAHMRRKYAATLSEVSNFKGGWLDHNPMWHGVATGFFTSDKFKFIVNLNKTSGAFTVYSHIETSKAESL